MRTQSRAFVNSLEEAARNILKYPHSEQGIVFKESLDTSTLGAQISLVLLLAKVSLLSESAAAAATRGRNTHRPVLSARSRSTVKLPRASSESLKR